jgi:hypothetical protein
VVNMAAPRLWKLFPTSTTVDDEERAIDSTTAATNNQQFTGPSSVVATTDSQKSQCANSFIRIVEKSHRRPLPATVFLSMRFFFSFVPHCTTTTIFDHVRGRKGKNPMKSVNMRSWILHNHPVVMPNHKHSFRAPKT